ncbi:hypothetical protein RJ640_027937, partial [Escallonia rubra]
TIPATIFNISTLQTLSVVSNQLSGNLPLYTGLQLANLEVLYLGNNSFTGFLPDSILNASKLSGLELSYNNFNGIVPNSLGNLGLLEILGLGRNNFISEPSSPELSFITSLTSCTKLRVLVISENSMTGSLPVSVGNLSVSLQALYAYGCTIRGTIPNEISNLSGLVTLYLNGNDLSGSIPSTIKGLQKLRVIDVCKNKLQGSIPNDLCQLPELNRLYLDASKLSGSVPACLWNINSLRYLYLSSNNLTSRIPASFGNLKDLLDFNASFNSLHGNLPPEIGNLKVVTQIDLSYNNFSGDIPGSIGNLQNLITLSLEHNDLIGTIPETFRSLVSLETLDLSQNKLSGPVAEHPRITYQEILEATNGFEESSLLEYGLRGSVSTSCDVYSYGIMLMETFTRKKRTDEMFAGQISLKCWVKESVPSAVIQVLDRNLLRQEGENSLAEVDCVSSILKLALDCAAESQEQRINMKDVLATLKKIRGDYFEGRG